MRDKYCFLRATSPAGLVHLQFDGGYVDGKTGHAGLVRVFKNTRNTTPKCGATRGLIAS